MDNFLHILNLGGPMMIPLIALALVGLTIFLERVFFLHKGQIRAEEFVSGIKTALKKRRLLEALTICDETPGVIPRIVRTALLNSEKPFDVMRQAVLAQSNTEIPLLERRISSMALIAKTAPYLGLMGTVLSLLEVFYKMGESGSYATAATFSAEVYSALISSAAGLMIFIAAMIGYSFLNSRLKAIVYDMQFAANSILLFIADGMPEDENLKIGGSPVEDKE